ncbi:hypothetical protein JYU34_019878 [Plutella xylostella]|uniref:Uncharacterized protein n=1 Tax=Plutella xylostella TaxID=51655 RepID=A0ABQ7PVM2_PLUXY|nr:hypothetical protein JYU34_019878 [Plutella xylostella]
MNIFENITFRRKRSGSEGNCESNNTMTTVSDRTIDGTTNSLPDTSVENDERYCELEQQIKQLTLELNTAHQEVQNLNLENSQLKRTIEDLSKKQDIINKVTEALKNDVATPKKGQGKGKINHSTPARSTRKSAKKISVGQNSHSHESPHTPGQPMVTRSPEPNIENAKKSTLTSGKYKKTHQSLAKATHKFSTPMETKRKVKLCILNGNIQSGTVDLLDGTFRSSEYTYCHYKNTNSNIDVLLSNIDSKLQGFNLSDYCIIMIGESDFLKPSMRYEGGSLSQNPVEGIELTGPKIVQKLLLSSNYHNS